jgi:hypothetical protein
MRIFRFFPALLITGFLLVSCLPAQSQFVTLARKIKSNHSGSSVESAVVLDAHTNKVYQAVVDTVSSSAKIKILQRDDSRRLIEFTNGKSTLTMKVDSIDKKLTHISVTSPVKDETSAKTEQLTVKAIMAVCTKLGIKCTIEEK